MKMLIVLALFAQGDLEKELSEVLPSKQDEAYRQVAWKTNLLEARAEAKKTGKPIFLWVMDGHPLGCT